MQVLRAAAEGFARKGIHQTTMQEICEASGMSAGALYRYFPTKESIIVAFAEEERAEAANLFSHLNSAPNIVSALSEIVPELINGLTDENYGRLTLEVAAEAARNPAVKAAFDKNETELCERLSAALLRGQTAGHVDPELDRDSVVFLLIALLDGIAGRAAFSPEFDKRRLARGVDHLLRSMLTAPMVAIDKRSK
ncbi:TetR/AcrR family transcriptional regulator [Hyphomicrobium sp.]|uniref:TetR/AcrR family transcriptional regulator n=1 Tax=Hyphomicrobium sp. TaxID=82 RepID=UPI002E32D204|nr:TetR/AcrR family transcriptional regulator [Hyphomicrobium sp.]HEX2842254.1 TetR/AcrR family transcriptional regulator [Hyphomicrobium sp.]